MTAIRSRSRRALVAAIAAVAAAAIPAAAAAHPPDGGGPRPPSPATRGLLRRAHHATLAFRDVDAAIAAGYQRSSVCESDPKYRAMGIHYANPVLVADGTLDVGRPEVLVYEPTAKGGLRLVALEYFAVDADQDLATNLDRPSMFGVPFDGPMLGHNPEMPIHDDLHVWLYRHNPAGLFAMWNPRVRCPDSSPS